MPELYDTLWKAKKQLEDSLFGGHRVTWPEFLEQAGICLEAQLITTPIKATRYNQYIYGAVCPKCENEAVLKRRKRVVWRVKCLCGNEFIAVI